jgi:hypothetical protein
MSDKLVIGTFIALVIGLCLLLGTQAQAAQAKCETLNQNNAELLKLCPTLGN